MGILRRIFRPLFSRTFWTLIGLLILCAAIWIYGPLVSFGDAAPLAGELARILLIAVILLTFLFWLLIRQIRAARANRAFVEDLAAEPSAPSPGEEHVAEVQAKFAGVLDEMKRSKLGGRKFLREMPWYLFIGPPGTGKTTALRQSGLHFPIDLTDDLKGVGGTRNCDWFFTEDAVLIDTAGRYVEQASDPEVDAQEWRGFLQLLLKHRGRRALNGVIVAISVRELTGDEASIRAHGREIRKRLNELTEQLEVKLPVYLMVTKADLIPGFESHFGDLTTREREQVWGATLGLEDRVDAEAVDREARTLISQLEDRMVGRLADDMDLARRAEAFRFPGQLEELTQPLKTLTESVFGESRYEETPWLRGFYLSSATQEGSPIDRMLAGIGQAVGLQPPAPERRAHRETRSFFLRRFLTDLVFPEAGLGRFDPRAEERRAWLFRGTTAAATLALVLAATLFIYGFMRYSGAIEDQERQFTQLSSRLANVAARQAPTDPLDLDLALEAATETRNAASAFRPGFLATLGPTAQVELDRAGEIAYERTLRNVLEPRMVAMLEATMWRHSRDPEFLLGALKSYQMMTGQAPYDPAFLGQWWQTVLPDFAPIDPFPTEAAIDHQIAALERMAAEETKIEPDDELVSTALESICTIPLSVRAYRSLLERQEVVSLPEWIPAEFAGPNGPQVLTRLSGKTLRQGVPGAYTYEGFHEAVLPLVPEVAAEATLDRAVFAGGCAESSEASTEALERDVLKLYYDDFIAQWDGLLRDIRLEPLDDLREAQANLKDLAAPDSALKRLLEAVVDETHLTRTEGEGDGGAPEGSGKVVRKAASKLGKIGKLVRTGTKIARATDTGGGEEPDPPGQQVADHFAPIRATVLETDGQAPLLGEAEAALQALSSEIQGVVRTPDPEQALL